MDYKHLEDALTKLGVATDINFVEYPQRKVRVYYVLVPRNRHSQFEEDLARLDLPWELDITSSHAFRYMIYSTDDFRRKTK